MEPESSLPYSQAPATDNIKYLNKNKHVLFYYPINTTYRYRVLGIFDTTICFGRPHQPSSGRVLVHKKSKKGEAQQTVGVKLLYKYL